LKKWCARRSWKRIDYRAIRRIAMPPSRSPSERIRPRFGDIIGVSTPKGLAYAQYTHRHTDPPRFGPLLRVIPGLFASRPDDFGNLVQQRPAFMTFFPLGAAANRRMVRIVASSPIPEHAKRFPIFRGRNREGAPWYLWDGKREWRVAELTPEQLTYPVRSGVVNHAMLVHLILKAAAS
jgi:hypothetical protein